VKMVSAESFSQASNLQCGDRKLKSVVRNTKTAE